MAHRLKELGIGPPEVQSALAGMADGDFRPQQWSGKAFLIDPQGGRAWGLKLVMRSLVRPSSP